MGFVETLAAGDRVARTILDGRAITYSPGSGSPVVVTGIFDAAYVRVDAGQPGISSYGPAVFFALSDLPSNPQTDTAATVTIGGVVYTSHEVKPDGLGGVVLFLHRV